MVAGGVFVGLSAQRAILESSSGSVSEIVLDPTAPGFRAFTESTPVVLTLHTVTGSGGGAELSGATILVPADQGVGGTVVTIPASFVRTDTSATLADTFATAGLEAVVEELATTAGSAFSDVVVLDGTAWTSLMREDLPLQLTLSTDLVAAGPDGATMILVPAGTGTFDLLDVALIASHQNPGEPSLGWALRQQQVWQSWISRTAGTEDRPDLFELESGFASVIGDLASGEVSYRTIPTTTTVDAASGEARYLAQTTPVLSLFSAIIPFPESVNPGDRTPVLLLDSTLGELDQSEFVELITAVGGRVAVLGNTDGDLETTNRVQLHESTAGEIAVRIADALGAEIEDVPLEDATTAITVIMATPPDGS